MALFCQARPLTDLVILTREVAGVTGIEIRKLPARVHKMERLAPDVMGLHLKLPANDRLQFLAGQYIDLLLPGNTRRSFSMANAPHDDAFLQLHVRNYGGSFSGHVFSKMKERDILRFEGPFGTFFLREDSDKPIILLASGTGFAPSARSDSMKRIMASSNGPPSSISKTTVSSRSSRITALSKFKATCLVTLERVRRTGRPLHVTRFGKPVADIVPPSPEQRQPRWMGSLRGTLEIRGHILSPSGDLVAWDALE